MINHPITLVEAEAIWNREAISLDSNWRENNTQHKGLWTRRIYLDSTKRVRWYSNTKKGNHYNCSIISKVLLVKGQTPDYFKLMKRNPYFDSCPTCTGCTANLIHLVNSCETSKEDRNSLLEQEGATDIADLLRQGLDERRLNLIYNLVTENVIRL